VIVTIILIVSLCHHHHHHHNHHHHVIHAPKQHYHDVHHYHHVHEHHAFNGRVPYKYVYEKIMTIASSHRGEMSRDNDLGAHTWGITAYYRVLEKLKELYPKILSGELS